MKGSLRKVCAVAAAVLTALTLTGCKTLNCANCGKSFTKKKGEILIVEGIEIPICNDCIESVSYTCVNCGKSFRLGEGEVSEIMGTEVALCKDCASVSG